MIAGLVEGRHLAIATSPHLTSSPQDTLVESADDLVATL